MKTKICPITMSDDTLSELATLKQCGMLDGQDIDDTMLDAFANRNKVEAISLYEIETMAKELAEFDTDYPFRD